MILDTHWLTSIITLSIKNYFQQDNNVEDIRNINLPQDNVLENLTGIDVLSFDEQVILRLALMPHLSPQTLDIFFTYNKNFNRPYTEFGGWKGVSHNGFLPTGETAIFILTGDNCEKRKKVIRLFQKEHWFYTRNILRLEGAGEGEPFLSGQLRVSDEFLHKVLFDREYKPDYSTGFPAKRITTDLEWEDLVLDYQVMTDLEEVNTWINCHRTIMEEWTLNRFLKAGYRSLFYGPPGTGKTLAATLIGKRNDMDVYRVDLSMIVSKYIGETEKNLARVFDMAENRNWILFFDEADALFGKRTSTNTSNDRHANQEVAYLLQRVEDFPGIVILATNLHSNIDEAFSRRFQSIIYFPMPDKALRIELWKKMLPSIWSDNKREIFDELINIAAEYELSGGAISNVIRRCAIHIVSSGSEYLGKDTLKQAIQKELNKI
ncbi:MAG: ATP-binding protein [Dysgonomonas sp.]|nr:ATP-binding protein [Dysgonomonas sp.]